MHLLYTNDLHHQSAPLELLPSLRRPESVFLDGGDAIAGSNTAFCWNEPRLSQLRQLGCAAMAMGNREFHYLRWLLRWREQERQFPLLAANLVDLTCAQWPWRAYCQVPHPHLRIWVIGLTPVQFPVEHFWEKLTGFRFLAPQKCLPPLVEELRPQADVLILLSHLGLKADLEWRLPLDLVLGAHSHDVTPEPIYRGRTAIVQTGSHGRYLGEMEWSPERVQWRLHPCRANS